MELVRLILSALAFYLTAYLAYSIVVAIYNITLHPLAKFPGPKLWAAFHFPQYWEIWNGNNAAKIKSLHDKFGEVVRISPRALSFSSSQAWRDIYAHKAGRKELEKDPETFFSFPGQTPDLIFATNENHARMRKLFNPAFSDSALRDQEEFIHSYCDLLITKLHSEINGTDDHNKQVEITSWLNFTTFDIVGYLCFGESFHALEKGVYHDWIANLFKTLKLVTILRPINAYTIPRFMLLTAIKWIPAFSKAKDDHEAYTISKTTKRIQEKTSRKDFLSYVLRANDEKGMTFKEISANAAIIIMAGSETTATLMSGLVFHLLKSPQVFRKLKNEILNSFQSPKDMTFAAEAKLRYLQACIEEALRMYPPISALVPRVTAGEGSVINGFLIPKDISVGVHFLSAALSARNFKDPDKFIPERWLGQERYAEDDRSASQPFSMGQRGCIGKSLAYAEIRSILVRLLWNFDMDLCEDSANWNDQKVFLLWDKGPLNIKLSAREHI